LGALIDEETRVVVLCGGRGVRLKPATDYVPKALVHVNGRPILDYIIDSYSAKGLKRFVLCVGYKGELIEKHFENPPEGLEISISDAGETAGMLRRIWETRALIERHALISYCDTFIDLDVEGMMRNHVRQRAGATIVSARIRNPFGLVTLDSDNWVTSFVEKPVLNYYIGSFILNKSALSHVTPEMLSSEDGGGLVSFFDELGRRNLLAGFEHEGMQITFNTESERREAEEYLGRFFTVTEEQ
jgi:NDP-sugar pyrophosphorylase family protein